MTTPRSEPGYVRPTVASLQQSGRLTTPATDPYAAHYARHEHLVDALASLLEVDAIVDMGPLLDMLLPGIRRPVDCWDELSGPLTDYRALDGVTAVSLEQERGQRAPNAADSYGRVADGLRQEIGQVIRRHRTAGLLCGLCRGRGQLDSDIGYDVVCWQCDGTGDQPQQVTT